MVKSEWNAAHYTGSHHLCSSLLAAVKATAKTNSWLCLVTSSILEQDALLENVFAKEYLFTCHSKLMGVWRPRQNEQKDGESLGKPRSGP